MKRENKDIKMSGEEAIEVLKNIEIILISLHKIGSSYVGKSQFDYAMETCRFIDEWKVTHKLADIRSVISQKFDCTLGDDDMDDLERAMKNINFWESEGDIPISSDK